MNEKGFTVTELLVTVAVLGIMSSISIPFFSTWLPNYRLSSSVRQIYDHMGAAKLNAVKTKTVAVIEFSITNDTYTVFLDTSGNWALDSSESVLSQGTLEDGIDIYNSTFPSHTYGFSSRGMSQTPLTGPYEVYLKNSKGRYLGVRVNTSGNLTIINSTDSGSTWN